MLNKWIGFLVIAALLALVPMGRADAALLTGKLVPGEVNELIDDDAEWLLNKISDNPQGNPSSNQVDFGGVRFEVADVPGGTGDTRLDVGDILGAVGIITKAGFPATTIVDGEATFLALTQVTARDNTADATNNEFTFGAVSGADAVVTGGSEAGAALWMFQEAGALDELGLVLRDTSHVIDPAVGASEAVDGSLIWKFGFSDANDGWKARGAYDLTAANDATTDTAIASSFAFGLSMLDNPGGPELIDNAVSNDFVGPTGVSSFTGAFTAKGSVTGVLDNPPDEGGTRITSFHATSQATGKIKPVPEPGAVIVWSVLCLSLAGALVLRRKR